MSERDERTFSEKLRDSTAHLPPSAVPAPNEIGPLVGALVHALDGAGGDQLAEHLPAREPEPDRDPSEGYSRSDQDFEARVQAEADRREAERERERQPASTDAAPTDQPASTEPGAQPATTPAGNTAPGNDAA
jgi:hypothetical protein